MNYAAKWNKIDSAIFFFENRIKELGKAIVDSKEAEPDVELMIQAETEHLRNENEHLKKREIPAYLIKNDDGQYLCPKCMTEISDITAKYCFNCGHRIILKYEKKS
jgi:DNA-directed RNA polymerase subunit RPC12/RpoP